MTPQLQYRQAFLSYAKETMKKQSTDLTVVKVIEQPARTAADIAADIARVVTADGKLDITVHNLAVECLEHAQQHGDFTLFARLIGDVKTAGGVSYGRGVRSRRLGLLEWATKFSPIRVNGDGVMGVLPETSKAYVPFNVEAAQETPFYDLAGEAGRRTTNNPFGIEQMLGRIGSFSKAIDKAVEAGTLQGDEAALKTLAQEANAFFAKRAREMGLIGEDNKPVKASEAPKADDANTDDVAVA